MMTISQLCLIFIFSFVLGTQSQNGSIPTPGNPTVTPGNPTVTPGNPTVTPGNPTVTPGNQTVTAVPTAVKLNGTDPDGTPGLPDNFISTEVITILSEDTTLTDVTTPPIITSASSNTEIPTSATPSGLNCTAECGANETCSDAGACVCVEGYIRVGENSPCEAKTCDNSCTDATEHCSEENGYNCTCIEGYSRQGDDWPCMKLNTPQPEPMVTTDTPLPTGTSLTTDNFETPELTTEPSETTTPTKSAETSKPQKTSSSTKPTKPGESTTSPSSPGKTDLTDGPNYTGALIGLFIFLVVTCFVFVAVYVVRRRKLRNNYGRLDEDNEGDSGWSAFSKNPIYRGDRDYQLL